MSDNNFCSLTRHDQPCTTLIILIADPTAFSVLNPCTGIVTHPHPPVLSFNDCAPAEAAVIAACDAERLRAPAVGHALPAHVVVARVARQPVRVVVGVRVAARRARLAREHDRAPANRMFRDLVPWSSPGCRTGNGEKLSSSQAEPGQAIKSAVA